MRKTINVTYNWLRQTLNKIQHTIGWRLKLHGQSCVTDVTDTSRLLISQLPAPARSASSLAGTRETDKMQESGPSMLCPTPRFKYKGVVGSQCTAAIIQYILLLVGLVSLLYLSYRTTMM